mmetsp:Transcript_27150/g.60084  ORF Transcript_27150/g.60084 Transcript_27150/m.60084 type:complete len:469 (+) Transcript_27150:435-1841(+)
MHHLFSPLLGHLGSSCALTGRRLAGHHPDGLHRRAGVLARLCCRLISNGMHLGSLLADGSGSGVFLLGLGGLLGQLVDLNLLVELPLGAQDLPHPLLGLLPLRGDGLLLGLERCQPLALHCDSLVQLGVLDGSNLGSLLLCQGGLLLLLWRLDLHRVRAVCLTVQFSHRPRSVTGRGCLRLAVRGGCCRWCRCCCGRRADGGIWRSNGRCRGRGCSAVDFRLLGLGGCGGRGQGGSRCRGLGVPSHTDRSPVLLGAGALGHKGSHAQLASLPLDECAPGLAVTHQGSARPAHGGGGERQPAAAAVPHTVGPGGIGGAGIWGFDCALGGGGGLGDGCHCRGYLHYSGHRGSPWSADNFRRGVLHLLPILLLRLLHLRQGLRRRGRPGPGCRRGAGGLGRVLQGAGVGLGDLGVRDHWHLRLRRGTVEQGGGLRHRHRPGHPRRLVRRRLLQQGEPGGRQPPPGRIPHVG